MDYIALRTMICRNCPICDHDAEVCNAHLYINPDTDEVSDKPKEGYFKGCGCHLKFKVKKKDAHCPANKW